MRRWRSEPRYRSRAHPVTTTTPWHGIRARKVFWFGIRPAHLGPRKEAIVVACISRRAFANPERPSTILLPLRLSLRCSAPILLYFYYCCVTVLNNVEQPYFLRWPVRKPLLRGTGSTGPAPTHPERPHYPPMCVLCAGRMLNRRLNISMWLSAPCTRHTSHIAAEFFVSRRFRQVGWIVSGAFTIVAIAASAWLINKHLLWYTNVRSISSRC